MYAFFLKQKNEYICQKCADAHQSFQIYKIRNIDVITYLISIKQYK